MEVGLVNSKAEINMEFKIEINDLFSYKKLIHVYLTICSADVKVGKQFQNQVIRELPLLISKNCFPWLKLACEYFPKKLNFIYIFQKCVIADPGNVKKFKILEKYAKNYRFNIKKCYPFLVRFFIERHNEVAFKYFLLKTKIRLDFLRVACSCSNVKAAKYLIELNPGFVTEKTLLEAAKIGSLDIVKIMCKVKRFSKNILQEAVRVAVPFYNSHLAAELMGAHYVGDVAIIKFLKDKIGEIK